MGKAILLLALTLGGCGWANLDDVKAKAPEVWRSVGYEPIGYEGYEWGMWVGGPYGGAKVWHSLRRPGSNVIYTGFVIKWGREYHVYGPRAVDAISPHK